MKKLLRNSALIGVFYYLLVLVNACCHCEVTNYKYDVRDIWTQNEQYTILGDSAFSFDLYSKDTINAYRYGLSIFFDLRYTSFHSGKLNLVNSAFACKCSDGYTAKDSIKNIEIITLNDFDESHLKSADVTEYFFELDKKEKRISYNAINENLRQYDYLWNIREPLIIRSYLKAQPTLNKELRFDVKINFKNGKMMHYFTKPVVVI